MPENFFHYPDETIFHATETDGFTFKEARIIIDEQEKILKLKRRLTDYYINGLISIPHSFMMAIMTCVGIEVLGQIILGCDSGGESIAENTISVYKMLDTKLNNPLTQKFKTNYARNRNILIGQTKDFSTYAHILRKGLRNAFTHNYRSLGVFLGGDELITINDDEGFIIVNHVLFRNMFIELYEDCFNKIISNSSSNYRQNALKYFELLIK
jgi:hypothetical protein